MTDPEWHTEAVAFNRWAEKQLDRNEADNVLVDKFEQIYLWGKLDGLAIAAQPALSVQEEKKKKVDSTMTINYCPNCGHKLTKEEKPGPMDRHDDVNEAFKVGRGDIRLDPLTTSTATYCLHDNCDHGRTPVCMLHCPCPKCSPQ